MGTLQAVGTQILYRSISMNANQFQDGTFPGNHLFDGINANAHIIFKNYWEFYGGTNLTYNVISNTNAQRRTNNKNAIGNINSWII